jgi:3-isopropylmalate dehydratase small subunit
LYLSTSERNSWRDFKDVPEWLQAVQKRNVVVARKGFGHGTAQELAAMALHGKFSYPIQAVSNPSEFGVKCVIAEADNE